MNYYEIGQRIRKYRKAYNISQEQLAEAIGISVTHMSHIETGNTKLSLPVLVAIAQTLNVQTDELIYGTSQIAKTSLIEEIANIIDSCSVHDMYILLDTIKALKASLDKHRDTDNTLDTGNILKH